MSATKKTAVAFLVQVEDRFGQKRIAAQPVRPQSDGELHAIMFDRFGENADVSHLADLNVTAYLGHDYGTSSDNPGEVWGLGRSYTPHHIESADHAKAIASTLTKIENGLRKLQESAGYLPENDFGAYLLRIATVLRIPEIYVRNTTRALSMSGETYRKVNQGALQYWVQEVSERAAKREYAAIAPNLR